MRQRPLATPKHTDDRRGVPGHPLGRAVAGRLDDDGVHAELCVGGHVGDEGVEVLDGAGLLGQDRLAIPDSSRPASSQWRRSTSSLLATCSGETAIRLQASPYRATRRSVLRSPELPMSMVGWGRTRGGGEQTVSASR
jgi:hypothetical protein